jgi:multiple antibiotic resistance protein
MLVEFALSALVTLLVVVEPIGLVPIFLSLTEQFSTRARRQVAFLASLIAGLTLIAFALVGDWTLRQLGITLPAFRIAGGLLLFAIAFEMVYGRRSERQAQTAGDAVQKDDVYNIAAFPLAIPLLAGPGAITATLLLAGQAEGQLFTVATLASVITAVSTVCFVVFVAAVPIAKIVGTTGNLVLSRLLGIILAALAVQYVLDGIRSAF